MRFMIEFASALIVSIATGRSCRSPRTVRRMNARGMAVEHWDVMEHVPSEALLATMI